jgi:hypothetical protein
MSARLPFTQAKVTRAIAAAKKAGLRVTGIRPDGTVLVQECDASIAPDEVERQDAPVGTSWDDR